MKTIAERWRFFAGMCLPVGASEIQAREMRRAYYAGFFDALQANIEMAAESGPDDKLGVQMIQSLHDECRRFADEIAVGKA